MNKTKLAVFFMMIVAIMCQIDIGAAGGYGSAQSPQSRPARRGDRGFLPRRNGDKGFTPRRNDRGLRAKRQQGQQEGQRRKKGDVQQQQQAASKTTTAQPVTYEEELEE